MGKVPLYVYMKDVPALSTDSLGRRLGLSRDDARGLA
jgi:hypothetical protein